MKTKLALLFVPFTLLSCAKPVTHYPVIAPEKISRQAKKHEEYIQKNTQHKKLNIDNEFKAQKHHIDKVSRIKNRIIRSGQDVCVMIKKRGSCYFDINVKDQGGINAYACPERIICSNR